MKPLLKYESVDVEYDESERSFVNFDLGENEIRDFRKNDRVIIHRSQFVNAEKPKKNKRPKGKGKNRKNKDLIAEKEKKIAKALKKRQENEEAEIVAERQGLGLDDIEELEVDDDFDFNDYDMECSNAPSTRKSKSVPDDFESPFFGDSLVTFSEKKENIGFGTDQAEGDVSDEIETEDLKIKSPLEMPFEFKIDLEIPTKSAQLDRDLRSLKGDLEHQREYLCRIDPSNLLSIFKSSIE
jgi:hypothetical protein